MKKPFCSTGSSLQRLFGTRSLISFSTLRLTNNISSGLIIDLIPISAKPKCSIVCALLINNTHFDYGIYSEMNSNSVWQWVLERGYLRVLFCTRFFTNELKISIGIVKITVKHTFLEESINKVFNFNLKHFFTTYLKFLTLFYASLLFIIKIKKQKLN